ncbi:hypothetical protein H6G89_29100 [Oscillatoria sp. FACHB-1407]|uniref:hypothetical protein n=1 Tax=Oscillatoria sp. FACHB-1407 TaxID=2692847 RepID=UPI001687308F|nr:hypothetical protein [Oscillatoria sp. FACHB-1407]MBD2465069.1 hypothetical protein [Oscillatoria sp. FACHB-1407]
MTSQTATSQTTPGAEVAPPRFAESCLTPEIAQRPIWECYEVIVTGDEHQEVMIQHASGEAHKVLTFRDRDQTKFRFTPTQKGVWTFSTGGEIDINGDRPDYAKGFVAGQDTKWIRTATGEAFVPQYVMYEKPDIDQGLDKFIDGHGFTGFHIRNLRDFLSDPNYFEAVVLKTYRRGGVTHFWIWGDAARGQTPKDYEVDVDRLYTEIAARLSPLPGWTLGYGFDLFEWAKAEEIEELRDRFRKDSSYVHLIGARGHKNEYEEISSNLDYASWEWHRPTYEDYREHLEKSNNRPTFSEDRFRIRVSDDFADKDYNPELTRRGLWNSAIAGGVANIWGHRPEGKEFSEPYPNQDAIKTYSTFVSKLFTVGMQVDDALSNTGHCLRDGETQAFCYVEDADRVTLNLSPMQAPLRVFAVDTKAAYKEVDIPAAGETIEWQAPDSSDWAIAVMSQ